jgi:hypothetical protein
MRALNLWLGQTHEPQYILYLFQMDKTWSIRAGTTSALENHATMYPVSCLGRVRVLYILT